MQNAKFRIKKGTDRGLFLFALVIIVGNVRKAVDVNDAV